MWICLNDAFFSIVSKDCRRDELLVSARREGDIEKLFPNAHAVKVPGSDYLYRAVVKRSEIAAALAGEVQRVNYPNFKDSVTEPDLHTAYHRVWSAMATVQEPRPYGGSLFDDDFGPRAWTDVMRKSPKKKRAKKLGRGQ